ncbi:hypothetical protein [Macrococcus carouselicus]|uniref:Uncharacterized protein n=1 Tax=Macrococcus carouselicus TaxID=69969 RepID=A0A9Q8FN64_9STAP|nr:hypothetical protein [Macrococcus carouselicus]TDM03845.1 hypothetical protein ERX40_01385 [Macrococcus carouselicus]
MKNDKVRSRAPIIYTSFIYMMFNIAFILGDWKVGPISFSDIIVILSIIFLGFYFLDQKINVLPFWYFIIAIFFLIYILINIIANIFLNQTFDLIAAAISFIKLSIYLIYLILFCSFVKSTRSYNQLLTIAMYTSVIVMLIGFYIYLVLTLKLPLPYEFFWTFGRQDENSYTYYSIGTILIRARSIFNEPAHYGFYLNILMTTLLFSRFQPNKSIMALLYLSLVLTLSYSSYAIFMMVILLYNIKRFNLGRLFTDVRIYGLLLVVLGFIYFFWDMIEHVIVDRTKSITSGADDSSSSRLAGSWDYIHLDTLFTGNGIGNAPEIFNIYAYYLTDLGLIAFIAYTVFTFLLLYYNPYVGIIFIMLNFQKGGYLAAMYWLFVTLFILMVMEYRFKGTFSEEASVEEEQLLQ